MDPSTHLAHAVRALTGTDAPVTGVHPLTGGTKKAVRRLRLGHRPLIAYLWHPDHDHGNHQNHHPCDPFSPASGAHLFHAAHTLLADLGLPVPHLYALDTTRTHHPAHIALLQDLGTTSLADLLDTDPHRARAALDHLRGQLHTLHTHTHFGRPGQLGRTPHPTCTRTVLERALDHLDRAAHLEPDLAPHHTRLHQAVCERAAVITPGTRHGLIHGELGPEHVLVTPEGTPHLIDIEGLMFFDTEWEHAYLRMRLGPHHTRLATTGQDPDRIRLHTLALHLSLVAEPLDLLTHPDCPEPEQMRAIARTHTDHLLTAAD